MRKRIFEIIEKAEDKDIASTVYDYLMMIAIIASLVPLAFKNDNQFFFIVDKVTVCIFIIDYFLRWITAIPCLEIAIKISEALKSNVNEIFLRE